MAEDTPVAFGAWRGRSWRRPAVEEPVDEVTEPVGIALADLVSILAIVIGFMAGAVGMAALLGWPGILIAVWVTGVVVGVLIGIGD